MSIIIPNLLRPIPLNILSSSRSSLLFLLNSQIRSKSSSTSTRWKQRQNKDQYTREARELNLRSRAAFKLLQIDKKYNVFSKLMSQISNSESKKLNVVDLGFAPGAWSQVALELTKGKANILGVDILPCSPPAGVHAMQANILSKKTHENIREFFHEMNMVPKDQDKTFVREHGSNNKLLNVSSGEYFEAELTMNQIIEKTIEQTQSQSQSESDTTATPANQMTTYPVDLVLSDMCAPFLQLTGHQHATTNNPYFRMSNTSGLVAKDHLSSMDLCDAALILACDLLRPGGSLVMKFFTGSEDSLLEKRLNNAFGKVIRFKPKATRSASKESYFICLMKKKGLDKLEVFNVV